MNHKSDRLNIRQSSLKMFYPFRLPRDEELGAGRKKACSKISSITYFLFCFLCMLIFFDPRLSCRKKKYLLPWRRGIVVISSAYTTEDPGFESRKGVML
jgi:hypothetical protein